MSIPLGRETYPEIPNPPPALPGRKRPLAIVAADPPSGATIAPFQLGPPAESEASLTKLYRCKRTAGTTLNVAEQLVLPMVLETTTLYVPASARERLVRVSVLFVAPVIRVASKLH